MRGAFVDQSGLFSYVVPEARVPVNHPLRKIRELMLGELPTDNWDGAVKDCGTPFTVPPFTRTLVLPLPI